MTTPPEPMPHVITARDQQWVELVAKVQADSDHLRDRLALAEQAIVDAGLHEDRLRAVVTGYAVFLATRGLQDEADRFVEARSRLARLDETTPP